MKVINMAKLRIAHASTHGIHKPPGPKSGSETLEETAEENVEPTVALTSPSLYIENES